MEYTFVVTNTGNVTLSNVEVNDPLFGITFGPITLAPNSSQTYTHTYTVTQMALDTGSVYNVASVTSEDTNGNPVTDSDDETITADQNPSIEIVKSALPTTYSTLGEEVEYTFVVTNTGNVTLSNVEVNDPLFGLTFGPITLAPNSSQTYTHTYTVTQMALDTGSVYNVASVTSEDTNGNPVNDSDDETITADQNPSVELVKFGPITLAPNSSQTYTHTYTVTQMALDTGSVYNVASVTSEDTNGNPVNDSDDETITANQNPSIEIVKSANPTTYSTLGEEVEYTFVVTNTGNVTLSNVEVNDPLFGITFGPITLAPNSSQTYTHTYTVTQMALDTGSVYNVASVTSEDTNGNPVNDSDDETITANQNPSVELVKSALPTTYSTLGEEVEYTFVVTNTGNVTLSNVEVNDPLFGLTFGPITLAPNSSQTYTHTYTVTQMALDTGSVYNVASVTSEDTNGNPINDTDDETITADQNPSIILVKSALPTTYSTLGEEVEYTFVVTNTGNVTLTNVEVNDPLFGLTFGPITLAPNSSQTYTHTYTVTQMALDTGSVYNVANVTSEDTNGNPVTDSDDETITADQNPSIELVKSALPTTYSTLGEEVEYSFVVTNTGNVTLSNVEVNDPLFGLTFGPITLAPNSSQTYTHTYTVTQMALDTGSVYNVASVTSEDTNGNAVNDSDDETITADQNPSIELVKSALPTIYSNLGEEVEYTFVVTNTGNVTLSNVEVNDPLFGLTFGPITLAPNSSQTYTHTYTVTQMALDTGSVYNVASVTSEDTNGNPVTDSDDETITANQNPSIELVKSALPTTYSTLGEEVEYTFVVTNTGNVTLTNVEVNDPLFGITFGPITLLPNTSATFMHNYEITQIDLDLGSVFNEAEAIGFFDGIEYSSTDDATIIAIQNPALDLVKSALPQIFSTPGEEIEYTFQITNTGNVTLENIDVIDPLFSLHYISLILPPGQSETFTYTYYVTQEAIDSGSVHNVASAHFVFDSKDYYDSDDETINAIQNPSIEIIKTAVPTTYSTLGEEVEYTFVVTNTGNVTLSNVEVNDPLFGLTFGPITLAPNSSQTYNHTYTVTQMALDTGSVYNVASVTSEDTNGNPITDNDDETITANQNPSVELVKSALPTTYTTLGEEVEYTFVVTNTGNVTLSNVEVTDPLFGLTFGPITLAPNSSQTYNHTYTVTQMALDTGSVYNVASVTSEDTNGNPVNDSDDETITADQNPSIEIVKSALPTTYSTLGEEVEYTFVVTNTGNVTLSNVEVNDPLFGLTFGPITLAPNSSQTYTHTYTVTQMALDTGSVYNVASVTSEDTNGNPVNDSDDETITANQNPSVELVKSALPTTYSTLGEEVEYTFVVTNTGNVTLSNVEVNDPLFGLTFGPITLAPNSSQTYTHTYTVTQMALDTGSVYNVASVTSEDTNGNPVTDSDDETITADQNPSIILVKSALPTIYSTLGEEVEYTFVVTNTGNVTLSNVEVNDPLFGLTFGPITLAPNSSQTYTHTYTVTQMALDTGSVYNVASVTSEDTNGNPVMTVMMKPSPQIRIHQ
ncbi:MAG: DUF11 domain-containing protein [Saprospiraceae bacterium]|nr:DUF11 domain-containing protein [Saprospiraceae bacterium]